MKTGVLLINLGTPLSPSVKDVKKYLTEFLNDPYVIDFPWLKRWFLVNCIIIPFRAKNSAMIYGKVWTKNGSPLLYNGMRLKEELQKMMGDQYCVELGMRYGQPAISRAIKEILTRNVSKIIAIPLYPQYAASSTESTIQKVKKIFEKIKKPPLLSIIRQFYDDHRFIDAWEAVGKKYSIDVYDHILFSFHGLPERHLKKEHGGSSCDLYNCTKEVNENNRYCYKAACYATARSLAERLNIPFEKYSVCFQSRLGKEPWIKPYSDELVVSLAGKGVKKLLVFSPAFVADCLETIYEIGIEYDELFRLHGGEKLTLAESLNTHPVWVKALKEMIVNEKI